MKALVLSMIVFLKMCQTAFSDKDCPILYQGIEGHSACLAPSADYISGDVSKEHIKVILDEHNKIRAAVKPPCCTMKKMYWYDRLAYVAQSWAKQCDFTHDKNRGIPGIFPAGQNLLKGSPKTTWKGAVNAWGNEVKDFIYGQKNKGEQVGHYTQIVNEDSTMIGCGFAKCKGGFTIFACNYGPSGNFQGYDTPWTKCKSGAPLIDCKGRFCRNLGKMKNKECECQCPDLKNIYGSDCRTNCSMKDEYPCVTFWKPNQCVKMNVPRQCPWMCNACPYIDETLGAAALKYAVISVLQPMLLFIANWLFQ